MVSTASLIAGAVARNVTALLESVSATPGKTGPSCVDGKFCHTLCFSNSSLFSPTVCIICLPINYYFSFVVVLGHLLYLINE